MDIEFIPCDLHPDTPAVTMLVAPTVKFVCDMCHWWATSTVYSTSLVAPAPLELPSS